jgi:dihydroxyacetone kinase-like protein
VTPPIMSSDDHCIMPWNDGQFSGQRKQIDEIGAVTTTIGVEEFSRMVQGFVQRVRSEHHQLSTLDSAIGDGDHGTTMLRAVNLLAKLLDKGTPGNLHELTNQIGWALLGIDGGSTGPLLGTFFLGITEAIGDKSALDAEGLAAAFEAGLATMRKQTKAQLGDKTMIDALLPAVEALRAAAEGQKNVLSALQDAAAAAGKGALSTRGFIARFGKARFSGERTLGHQDPGATSIQLMFEGFRDGLVQG